MNKAVIFATHNRELANKADYKLSISGGNIKRVNGQYSIKSLLILKYILSIQYVKAPIKIDELAAVAKANKLKQ